MRATGLGPDSVNEPPVRRVRAAVARRVAVDRRALAAFRVALGVVVLVDLARRAPDAAAFYTDAGVLPRSALVEAYPAVGRLSLHALSGGLALQVALFAAAAVAAVALVAGYRTRLATAVSLVLLVSLHARNPLVLNGGDVLLRRLLFWALFLPLGSRWAVDAPADGSHGDGGVPGDDRRDRAVAGVATAGLLVQVVFVYVSNAVEKLRADVWLEGTALRYAFQIDHFTHAVGDVVAGWGPVLAVAGWAWLALLVASPLLVVLTGRRRTVLVAAIAGFHAGMLVTMHVGAFPLVSLTALLPFLPAGVWDGFERVARRVAARTGARGGDDGTAGRARSWLRALGPHPPLARRVPALSGLARAVAACCLVAVVLSNAIALGAVGAPAVVPDSTEEPNWSMFASPYESTWWYAAPTTLESGRQVDALAGGGPVDRTRPAEVAATYPNERWRKTLIRTTRDPDLRRSLAGYLCRRWNASHADDAVRVRLLRLVEPTDLDGPETVRVEDLGTYRCGAVDGG